MLSYNEMIYKNGTADDVSFDATQKDLNRYSIDYDPNDGVINYGVVGEVGARKIIF